eukprot:3624771-Alexandrium_andersonii.AAC.1
MEAALSSPPLGLVHCKVLRPQRPEALYFLRELVSRFGLPVAPFMPAAAAGEGVDASGGAASSSAEAAGAGVAACAASSAAPPG